MIVKYKTGIVKLFEKRRKYRKNLNLHNEILLKNKFNIFNLLKKYIK